VLCWAGCKTCYGPTALNCTSCKNDGVDNYYLIYGTDICNLTCPDGQYQNASAFTCLLCSSECLTCTINSTYCTSCGISPSGLALFLSNGSCIFDCVAGQYENNVTHLCTACDTACRTCLDGTKNYCYSCGNVSTTQYYLIIGTTVCSQTCPVGQYIDAAHPNNCQPCSSNCVGCQGSASNCSADVGCLTNSFFNNATNSCLLVCPDAFYGDTITGFCESCAAGCALCYGSVVSKCTKCVAVGGTNYFK
jgi:proprotein convertase subtilisin/kexin type 5